MLFGVVKSAKLIFLYLRFYRWLVTDVRGKAVRLSTWVKKATLAKWHMLLDRILVSPWWSDEYGLCTRRLDDIMSGFSTLGTGRSASKVQCNILDKTLRRMKPLNPTSQQFFCRHAPHHVRIKCERHPKHGKRWRYWVICLQQFSPF